MRAYEVIKKKRDRGTLTPAEIAFVIAGFTDGSIPDYQMSALLMAIVLNGLDAKELAAWAKAMLESGKKVDLSYFWAVGASAFVRTVMTRILPPSSTALHLLKVTPPLLGSCLAHRDRT